MLRSVAALLAAPLLASEALAAGEPDSASADEQESAEDLEALDEVVISAERREPASTRLSRDEARVLPGALGDPFRAIEVMPGVTPIVSGLPFFFVRGAPPGNVGYFIDGVRVPSLYHIGFGPAVLPPALIEQIDFYPGGYPASFGRFAGAIMSANSTEPRGELHGELSLRLFDAGGVIETGFADGRGSVLVGGRYSYTAALLSALIDDLILDYRDYQTRVSYQLTDHDRVSLTTFGSYDLLGQSVAGIVRVDYGVEFHRATLRHEHLTDAGAIPGARVDVFASDGAFEWSIDPRLAARLALLPGWSLLARLALAHQAPAYNFPIPALAPALQNGLQRARQASLGSEIGVAGELQAVVSVFYNAFDNLTDEVGTGGLEDVRLVETRPSGRAFGGELSLRRRLTQRVGGMLSYTLSRSTRTLGGVEAPSAYDRTHVANLALGVDLGRGWRAGARALAYSGAPSSGFIASDPTLPLARDRGREPLFYRLDTRLEKRWSWSPERWVALVLEAFNTTARAEKNGNASETILVPSIGVEGGF